MERTKWEWVGVSALAGTIVTIFGAWFGLMCHVVLYFIMVLIHGLHQAWAIIPAIIIGILASGYIAIVLIDATAGDVDKKRITRAVDYIVEETRFSGMSQYEKEMMADYVWDIFDAIGVEKDIKDIYTLIKKDRED